MKKRKFKLFLIFVLCSAFAWFISKLSETYTTSTQFELYFENAPDSLLLGNSVNDKVIGTLRGTGFQFLGYNLKPKKIKIDLTQIRTENGKYYIPKANCKKQIEKQLPTSLTLLEINGEEIYLDLFKVEHKEVTVTSRVRLNLAQDYMIDGKLHIEPETIVIKGPKNEIDTITTVMTKKINAEDIHADFNIQVPLLLPPELKNTEFSSSFVRIAGQVARFSEKLLEVPIKIINLPPGLQIRTFPDKVTVICQAKIDDLKKIGPSDFQIIADYSEKKDENSNILSVRLEKKPDGLHAATLTETKIEFILKKE
ncbi:MAG: YbbR-like domain-containing protein [Maribacter sp.]|nr:YbbR-like domain-containing protein [Maribacter sp.]